MDVNVALVDDNVVTLRHLAHYLASATTVVVDDQAVRCTFHRFPPLVDRADPTSVDLDATWEQVVALKPGVAVIDLRLAGDAVEDYSGAALALRIKATCNDCCIILVSHYFAEAPRLLDNLEIFRFRLDCNRESFGEELRERFTEAVRYHVSARCFRALLDARRLAGERADVGASRAVYISYARGDCDERGAGREEIVSRIEGCLRTRGYDVRRDRTNVHYTGLISAFTKELGHGGCIVAVLSDKYLRSPFCMHELLEIHRHDALLLRLCPVVLVDARITELGDRLSYVEYWSQQAQRLEELIQKIKPTVLAPEQLSEFHMYRDIASEAGGLLTRIADMCWLTPASLEEDDFSKLRERIDQCIR